VFYLHLTQRCVSCLCFESRIKYVINTYYQEAVKNGDMSFTIINAQDKKNTDAVKKFGAVGTQLFVNTIVNGADHIRNVQEIWDWNCNNDPEGFMNKVRDVIDVSLAGKY